MVSETGSKLSTPQITTSSPKTPQSTVNSSAMDGVFSANTSLNNLTIVNFPTTLKLTSTNYLGWKTQIEALLHGLDLYRFIDGTHPVPPPTVAADGSLSPHKDYQQWFRQDRLLFGAIIGSLSPQIVPLVTNSSSSYEAWKILAATYASPSRGHIKQLQYRLKQLTKTANQSVTDYMQDIKVLVDELAILGKKLDQEDITDVVLNGLDQTTYKPIVDAIHARDSPISFNELHEKLINHELLLAQPVTALGPSGIHQPATAFYSQQHHAKRSWNNRQGSNGSGLLPTPSRSPIQSSGARPFLGKCQWCNQKGHSLRTCLIFKRLYPNASVPTTNRNMQVQHAQAHHIGPTNNPNPNTADWIFDSGASFHATNDLNNLSIHAPYDGTEELVIGDGSGDQNSTTQGHGNQGTL